MSEASSKARAMSATENPGRFAASSNVRHTIQAWHLLTEQDIFFQKQAMHIDWSGMFGLSISPWELVFRGTLMYWFIFVVLRFAGRRDLGSFSTTDMLLLVLIADAAQNGMSAQYNSITGGAILVFTLVFWSAASNRIAYFFPGTRPFFEPRRILLIKDGQLQRRGMRREHVSKDELMEELRLQGINDISDVRYAYMESTGDVSIKTVNKKQSGPFWKPPA